ncbi:Uncharacterised protein [Vibrio cholerae]|nr:Uncharacterised protein [Vibrio cholerae]
MPSRPILIYRLLTLGCGHRAKLPRIAHQRRARTWSDYDIAHIQMPQLRYPSVVSRHSLIVIAINAHYCGLTAHERFHGQSRSLTGPDSPQPSVDPCIPQFSHPARQTR